jgi:Flp pilus assembly protein TadD
MKNGQTADAIASFRDLVQAHPSNTTYRYHLAMALLQNGDRGAAQVEAKAALQLNPSLKEQEEIREFLRATQ